MNVQRLMGDFPIILLFLAIFLLYRPDFIGITGLTILQLNSINKSLKSLLSSPIIVFGREPYDVLVARWMLD
jgi:hypothetical protein